MPITKQTIAIIGSSSKIGASIAKRLCRDNYRLLLFEERSEEAESLSHEICSSVEGADVEFLTCKHLASWESDIIVIAKQDGALKKISDEIKEVSTQKIVTITMGAENKIDLKEAESHFPNSKVICLITAKDEPNSITLLSKHSNALDVVQEMLSHAGFVVSLKELHSA